MNIIKLLLGQTGDVRSILKSKNINQLDLSDDNWDDTICVLSSLRFENIILKNKAIKTDFSKCKFVNSTFSKLVSKGHFWGAYNYWDKCNFNDVKISTAISPQNKFIDCNFNKLNLVRYEPCDTTFINCVFTKLEINGMKPEYNFKNSTIRKNIAELMEYPEIKKLDMTNSSVLFSNCKLIDPVFKNCFFSNIIFENCTIENPNINGCNFKGISSDNEWWSINNENTIYDNYRDELLNEIRSKLGKNSIIYVELVHCASKYDAKEFRTKFFNIVAPKLTDYDYDCFERIVLSINNRYAGL